mmetsp:Transcript_34309/g.77771  ORF Transcript_34309/g.77771 Transcript_34309/m.77771 type:complete len:224 (-) Transcript_34309:1565-2236(-)
MLPTPSARSGSPCRSRKWATDNDLHDCPWTIRGLSHPGQIFSDSPHGEEPNQCEFLQILRLTADGSRRQLSNGELNGEGDVEGKVQSGYLRSRAHLLVCCLLHALLAQSTHCFLRLSPCLGLHHDRTRTSINDATLHRNSTEARTISSKTECASRGRREFWPRWHTAEDPNPQTHTAAWKPRRDPRSIRHHTTTQRRRRGSSESDMGAAPPAHVGSHHGWSTT